MPGVFTSLFSKNACLVEFCCDIQSFCITICKVDLISINIIAYGLCTQNILNNALIPGRAVTLPSLFSFLPVLPHQTSYPSQRSYPRSHPDHRFPDILLQDHDDMQKPLGQICCSTPYSSPFGGTKGSSKIKHIFFLLHCMDPWTDLL